ncbi:MAG: hypothetical protein ACLBM6_19335, partial [Cuspidothrix sp.]
FISALIICTIRIFLRVHGIKFSEIRLSKPLSRNNDISNFTDFSSTFLTQVTEKTFVLCLLPVFALLPQKALKYIK